ncbi:MAG TPA: hypothetical protein VFH11_04055 [Gemmatimonadota bacterium]|nr:hypothetical protein [Gemmatimonadota bacterium]
MRAEIDAFLEALERAEWMALSGRADAAGVEAIYDRYASLFEPDAFHAVEPPEGDSRDALRRAHLREFLAEGIEGHRTRDLRDAYLVTEAAAVVEVNGERIPYRRMPVRIRQESERSARMELDRARLKVIEKELNPISLETTLRKHEVAQELLDTDYDEYCERLSGIDFDELESRTTALLAETADPYDDLLAHFGRRALPGVDLRGMWTHDLSRLFHGEEFAPLFPGESMVPSIERMVSAMGLDLTAGGRIELDIEERPSKTPRAFCATIRIPDEVKLVLQPYGGHDDWSTFLHELGHALHFANVDPEQPLEFRRMGDNGVTEGWAMTFDHLMLLPSFLRRVAGIRDPEPYLRFAAFRELAALRRYSAKLSYERSLHGDGPEPARADEYATRLSNATRARTPRELWIEDVDPHFYCVRYLRAWMFAGAVHAELRDRYDVDWFLNPRSGPFLAELWALGQEGRVEDLARERLGVELLGFGPLMEMIDERI